MLKLMNGSIVRQVNHQLFNDSVFSMGYFKNTMVWGGGIMPPLVTSLFLKVEGQNLRSWGILMCLLQKWH